MNMGHATPFPHPTGPVRSRLGSEPLRNGIATLAFSQGS